ncbi:unnamed protein product [Vitrella brassicaformis CCMP3155]|uniref:Uncharacterized protein n=1 Tax=Vitrella brassicaformis (strain CCMP3155) TaxID=1169540 RepID=A0A0G4ERD5_VITBC|nr:unnamed protein product [Vitrella brassicaformis CCMP3155]|eukprot:CEL99852.1 unnamed protein product [Vitrella brassicaformis CCMP3155]
MARAALTLLVVASALLVAQCEVADFLDAAGKAVDGVATVGAAVDTTLKSLNPEKVIDGALEHVSDTAGKVAAAGDVAKGALGAVDVVATKAVGAAVDKTLESLHPEKIIDGALEHVSDTAGKVAAAGDVAKGALGAVDVVATKAVGAAVDKTLESLHPEKIIDSALEHVSDTAGTVSAGLELVNLNNYRLEKLTEDLAEKFPNEDGDDKVSPVYGVDIKPLSKFPIDNFVKAINETLIPQDRAKFKELVPIQPGPGPVGIIANAWAPENVASFLTEQTQKHIDIGETALDLLIFSFEENLIDIINAFLPDALDKEQVELDEDILAVAAAAED